MKTQRDIELRQKALRLWFDQCYETGDFERFSLDPILNPTTGEYYEEYQIPADTRDWRHPTRVYHWLVNVYADGGDVVITDEWYVDEGE